MQPPVFSVHIAAPLEIELRAEPPVSYKNLLSGLKYLTLSNICLMFPRTKTKVPGAGRRTQREMYQITLFIASATQAK